MCFGGTGNMISLDTCRGKLVLLCFLLLVRCLPTVWSAQFTVLNSSSSLHVGDTLVSTPLGHFELGIFQIGANSYYLCIRYAVGFDPQQVVTWVANRNSPVTGASHLEFNPSGSLQLSDQGTDVQYSWSTSNSVPAVSATLNDTGNLQVMGNNDMMIWNSFNNSPPTDTLLPGQYLYRNSSYNLTSWQKNGSPAADNGTYSFKWTSVNLTLAWTPPQIYLNWKGGPYIPAPDVHDAHTISDVDYVYFHGTLGHLYISSAPADTAILSGGPDPVNATILKRITISSDGGFRIWQLIVGQSNWTAKANWVVSDRPDSRSQCSSYGTCGPFGLCISPIDSLGPVQCQCPPGFKALNATDLAQGCTFVNNASPQCGDVSGAGMLELPGVDMPWSGDIQTLTGNDSVGCKEACMNNCNCTGAVLSSMEGKCWVKTGIIYNLGYPTVPLHGNDRTAFIKKWLVPFSNPIVEATPSNKSKVRKWVIVVVPAAMGGVVLIIGASVLCLLHSDIGRTRVQGCRLWPNRATIVPPFPGGVPSSDSQTSVSPRASSSAPHLRASR